MPANYAVAAREETARRHGFLTVVCFGNFRGDADGGGGVRPGCEEVAPKAPLPRAEYRLSCPRNGDRVAVALSSQAQTPAPALGNVASAGNAVSTGSTASSGSTAGPGSDLLRPSLGGNPATPPRFRRPGAAMPLAADQPPPDRFVAPTRIGATPIYGSPNGLGPATPATTP